MKSQFKLGVAGGSAGIARAQKLVEPIFVGSQGRAHAHYAPAINSCILPMMHYFQSGPIKAGCPLQTQPQEPMASARRALSVRD